MRNWKHVVAHEDRQVLQNGWTEMGTECEQRRLVREKNASCGGRIVYHPDVKDDWRRAVMMFKRYTSLLCKIPFNFHKNKSVTVLIIFINVKRPAFILSACSTF